MNDVLEESIQDGYTVFKIGIAEVGPFHRETRQHLLRIALVLNLLHIPLDMLRLIIVNHVVYSTFIFTFVLCLLVFVLVVIEAGDVVGMVLCKRVKIPLTVSFILPNTNHVEDTQITWLDFLVNAKMKWFVEEMLKVELAIVVVTTDA